MAHAAKKSRSRARPALEEDVQYLTNGTGHVTAVLVPIQKWRDVQSSLETLHLLKDDKMRMRLVEAMQRDEGISWEEALQRIGVKEQELDEVDLNGDD